MLKTLPNIIHKNESGEFYIGLLISLGVFGVLSAAFVTLLVLSYDLITFSRTRVTARHIAEDKIETIKNLPYDQVGTIGGIPAGQIAQTETLSRNGMVYTLTTSIIYIDDPFDLYLPDDFMPNDYKRIRVDVSWQGIASSNRQPMTIVTDIAPKTAESTAGGGTLSILVINSQGQPVSQADVTIQNTVSNPPIDLVQKTNVNGRIVLPGSPACSVCYKISATKPNYSLDRTYGTEEIANPSKNHASVIQNQLSEISFIIDFTSQLQIITVSDRLSGFTRIPYQPLIIKGQKLIGTDVADIPVVKNEQSLSTDSTGRLVISNLEWDNYTILTGSSSIYDTAGTNPLLPYQILPNTPSQITISLASHTPNSALLAFVDSSSYPISSSSASISGILEYTASGSAGIFGMPDYGQVFFKNLTEGIYHLEASAPGYLPYSGSISVFGNIYEKTILTPEVVL